MPGRRAVGIGPATAEVTHGSIALIPRRMPCNGIALSV
jgi:hypothetical protein